MKGQKKLQAQEVEEEDDDHGVIETFKTNITKNGKLYRRQLEAILNPEFKQEYEFPTLAGSYLHMKNPALELVKFLCHVFALSEKRSKKLES